MRIRFVALSLVLAVVAACTSTPIPDSFDWCYTYDFRDPVDYMNLIDGEWIDGDGIAPVDGLIRFNFQHIRIVEPNVVFVRASRAPDVTGDIAIAAAGEVFSVIAAFNNTMPGDMVDVELPFIPETLGTGSSVVNITLEAAQPILFREIEVRGIGVTPFDRNDCGPETPTPQPTSTPVTETPTPSQTHTVTPTSLPTLTPSITPTPNQPSPTLTSNCTPTTGADWCLYFFGGGNYDLDDLSEIADVIVLSDRSSYDATDNVIRGSAEIESGYRHAILYVRPKSGVTVTHSQFRVTRTGSGTMLSTSQIISEHVFSDTWFVAHLQIWFSIANGVIQYTTPLTAITGRSADNAIRYHAADRRSGGSPGVILDRLWIHGTGAVPDPSTPTPSPTPTNTPSPTATATPSRTGLPTLNPSSTIPATATQLSLFSPTPPPTNTPAPSATPRNTNTPWPSPTFIPSPTLFMTSTFVPTNTPAPGTVTPEGETQTPIPDLTPGGDDGEQEADDTGQAQLDVLWLILNLLSQFFNWIANVIGTFFAWLGQLFALIVGIFEAIISLIAAIIGLIIKLLEWLFNAIGLILSILWLLVQIIFRVIFLVAAWLGLVITRLAAIFNGIINAQPVPIPGLPLCETAPLQSDLCAIYYILDWTLFAPATPGESIITVAIGLTVLSIIFFVIYRLIRLTKTGSKGGFSC